MPQTPQTAMTTETPPPWERHYTVGQLSQAWGYSRQTILRMIEHEPGVVRYGPRHYVSVRVPESVARRVYRRHTKA